MERLQSVKIHRNYVMGIIQKAQMENDELVAALFLAVQMARPANWGFLVNFSSEGRVVVVPVFRVACANYRYGFVFLVDAVHLDADVEGFHEGFV